jgi:hypothetical protein
MKWRFEIFVNRLELASRHDIILYVMCGYQQIIARGVAMCEHVIAREAMRN